MPSVRRTRSVQYAGYKLWWRLFRGDVDRETIQQKLSIDEENNQEVEGRIETKMVTKFGYNRRKKSTIQKDEIIWKQHKDSYGEEYTLAICAKRVWDTATSFIPYTLVVMVELEDDSNVNIYQAIESMIETEVEVMEEIEI